MGKRADADIREALEFVGDWVEAVSEHASDADDVSGEDVDPDCRGFRQVETVLRRLAREAGYDLKDA